MYYILFSAFGSMILFLIMVPLYLRIKKIKPLRIVLTIKGLATMIPLLFCLVATIQLREESDLPFRSLHSLSTVSIIVLLGLLFGLIGDIVLEIHFVCGMGIFLIGHICYIIAFLKLAPFQVLSIGVFIVFFLLMIKRFYPWNHKMGKNKLPFYIYGIVIIAVASIALLVPFSIGYLGILPAVGASLFVLSDFLLAWNILVKVTKLSDAVSLYCYYVGQFTLAMSIYLYPLFL